ncbi:hypothetical protein B6N60_02210 [Richelia sinica FACHB-800]|uniref:Uncharacterized protein n=1 Tax=Richelia sinica FACHB-800 TaxID=1357546 RepID=A0A975Y4T6_9NOST|nr:T3SS effector HopA1 family protein [Richelia sinica]MBD2666163.1 hypothetical protein [Richelia sinica FACHB-800]QXE23520.1 hypothetical protein B6N60_02210 [Richelia sinica FACHB-800]
MQLLNSLDNQLSALPTQLQISLYDIVNKLEIFSHHCIKHPDYKPIELPESLVSRFQTLPLEIQHQHLGLQLRNFLYSAYYNGAWKPGIETDPEEKTLVNNSLFGIDIEFYDRLHTSNKSEGYWSHDWLVTKEETDGTLAVKRNGLTLHIERDLYLAPRDQNAKVGNLVAIKMPKNLVQKGFYMAVANLGSERKNDIVRLYFNLTPDGAVSMMENLTSQLNTIPISFSFKALYNPSDYIRYDSAVLYFEKKQYELVYPIINQIYRENQSYFNEQVPLFTKLLAPGLACAEEPAKKFGEQESFGTNRCQMIANGLISAWQRGDDSPESRLAAILDEFTLREIDLQCSYLNSDSEDIYTPLEV